MEIFWGIIAGIVASLGMGGGTILILLLSCFSSYNQHLSQGINYIFFLVVAIISGLMNKDKNVLNRKIIYICWLIGGIGSVVGCNITGRINENFLRKIFGGFLVIIAFFNLLNL